MISPRQKILIVEDHELLAQSLGVALEAEGFQVHLARPGRDVDVPELAAEVRPRVVLLDLDLGEGARNGEALLPRLLEVDRTVIVVTGATDVLRLGRCLELGAAGVLSKSRPFEDVLAAVTAAVNGEPVMRESDRQTLLARLRARRAEQRVLLQPFQRLTPREAQVLAQLVEGEAAEAIARVFVVSEATVRSQIRGVLTKLGVSSQLAAVAEARRVGWEGPHTGER